MHLELVNKKWIQEQPLALEFGVLFKNGKVRQTAVVEFLNTVSGLGLISLVDEAGRPFIDTDHPVWVRLTDKAVKRGHHTAATRGYDTLPEGKPPTYGAMHYRVKKSKGPAKNYPCDHCGGPAEHWAYDNDDPFEIRQFSSEGWGNDCAYSTEVEHYIPLCAKDHSAFDRDRRGGDADRSALRRRKRASQQAEYRRRVRDNNRAGVVV
jgi:hypothetical protein